MKKLLISIIIILVLILTGYTIIEGLKIGNLEILGITEIKKQNEKLDEKIKEATKKASTDYPKALDDLDKTAKEFQKTKAEYDDMVNVSTTSEVQAANQYGVYEIGMLWIELGNHAKSEGIVMDVSAKNLTPIDTNTASDVDKKYNCNLYFTATGTYAGIAGFIEDIEDDSKLGFRIEDFKIIPSSEGNTLQATFNCKDIIIRGISNGSVTTSEPDSTSPTENSSTTTNSNATNSNVTNSNVTNSNTTNNSATENTVNTTNNTVR